MRLSSNFAEYAALLVEIHRHISANADESEDAQRTRDRMDTYWSAMSGTERDVAQGLSADLYSIGSPSAPVGGKMPPDSAREIGEVLSSGDWARTIITLRKHQTHVPSDLLASTRGRAWSQLGLRLVALAFLREAYRLNPEKPEHRYLLLDCLAAIPELKEECRRESLRAIEDQSVESKVLIRATTNLFYLNREAKPEEARRTNEIIIATTHRAVDELLKTELDYVDIAAVTLALMQQGACYAAVGNLEGALRAHARALEVNPGDAGVFTARGLLLFGTDPAGGARNFEEAVARRIDNPWPYFFLAFYYVTQGRFVAALRMCQIAESLSSLSRKARAAVNEMIAISLAETGAPREGVIARFTAALELDPSETRIQENFRVYQASLHKAPSPRWSLIEAQPMASELAAAGVG
jgi:tetratricopeptide (TPR) repeat protein